jgi:hypothetical protein
MKKKQSIKEIKMDVRIVRFLPEEPAFVKEEHPNFTLEDYVALWGSDPSYDKAPLKHGDGVMFYNYALEKNNVQFLIKFHGAIERLIKKIQEEAKIVFSPANNEKNLRALQVYIQNRIDYLTKALRVVCVIDHRKGYVNGVFTYEEKANDDDTGVKAAEAKFASLVREIDEFVPDEDMDSYLEDGYYKSPFEAGYITISHSIQEWEGNNL